MPTARNYQFDSIIAPVRRDEFFATYWAALETGDFRVGDLPGGLDDSGKGVLVKRLIREGMVRRLM